MGNISILLADDSITIQKVVGIIFATDGYTLTVVDNGKAAVLKAREIQPDVLLIDAIMPDMSGYDVCAEIRKDPELSGKPLLLLTGSFEPFDEAKAKASGADDHLIKPFESQHLIAKVNELYALGLTRTTVAPVAQPVAAVAVEIPAEEPAFAPLPLDAAAFEAQIEQAPALEPLQPAASIDDPWGAYTIQPEPEAPAVFTAPVAEPEPSIQPETPFEPDVFEMVSQESSHIETAVDTEAAIGASWVPVEEQTFEFREEVAEVPAAVIQESYVAPVPEPEPAFDSDMFEPIAAVEPVAEPVAEVPYAVTAETQAPEVMAAETVPETVPEIVPVPAVPAVAVALTDEQLKAALMSASKETIERIVWEVVPDLAETLIKEAIRRITEGK